MHIRASKWGMSLYEDDCPRWAGFGALAPDPAEGLIASASREKIEELADYGDTLASENDPPPARWWRFKAASGAPRGRWHVIRYLDGPGITGQNLQTATGRLRTFKDQESAQRAADKANREVK